MTIFQSLIRKEALHIIRDRRTMIITLIMPLVLLLLFGFAISTEINNVRVVAVIDRYTPQTRDIVEKLRTNEYFTFEGTVAETDVADMMRRLDETQTPHYFCARRKGDSYRTSWWMPRTR